MIADQLRTILAKAAGVEAEKIHLEHPELLEHGDYSTNIALILKGGPKLAEEIAAKIPIGELIEKVDVAGPGFINIWLSKDYLLKNLNFVSTLEGTFTGKKIVVEYTDPNPFKELHIGHLYSNVIGETVAKIFEAEGATVWRANFYGDVGLHVAKSVWGIKQKLSAEKISLEELGQKSPKDRQQFLGSAYAYGTIQYEADSHIKEQINNLNTLLYVIAQNLLKEEKGWTPLVDYQKYVNAPKYDHEEIKTIYKRGLKWSLEYFESLYKILGTKFDGYYPESLVGEYGYELVMEGLKKRVFEESQGAIVFRGEKIGQHTRVFINKNNLPTYEAKDLGLAVAKYKDFAYDLDINVTGNEIKDYFKVVLPALSEIRPQLGKATFALSHGMVNLPEGKMSSRSGNVVTIEKLLSDATKHAQSLFTKDKSELSENDKAQIAQKVGMAAIRYAFLKSGIGNDISFSFKDSLTFEGNSGPYLQYTYARICSVLAKAKNSPPTPLFTKERGARGVSCNDQELSILRYLYRFPEVVEEAARRFAPNLVCVFLYELAQRYNSFYNKCSILNPESGITPSDPPLTSLDAERSSELRGGRGSYEDVREFRLAMSQSVAEVLKQGLDLLGIATLERM